jgi:hypothetical protein
VASLLAGHTKEAVVVVTVTTKSKDADYASDVLAGWKELPDFIFGYVTEQARDVQVVALFDVLEGPIGRGQRKVVRWETSL